MNELLYIFNEICNRRAVKFVNAESVAFNVKLMFGLPDLTPILPPIANVFYYARGLCFSVLVAQTGGVPLLRIASNSGQGSAGNIDLIMSEILGLVGHRLNMDTIIECDSMLYIVNGNTAGTIIMTGEVFKITYKS